ncbi:MAG TPA: hypothetical protein PKO15_08885, partial [Fibrobacteria bacterium]|nr:hypothetical protein [Fibrobacteria bacterium]
MNNKVVVCCVHGDPQKQVGAWRPYLLGKLLYSNNFEIKYQHRISSDVAWYLELIKNLAWLRNGVFWYTAGPFRQVPFVLIVLSVFLRAKFVFDLRDGFSLNYLQFNGGRKTAKYWAASFVEYLIFFRCKKFVVTTEGNYRYYFNRFGSKVELVPNGHTLSRRVMARSKSTKKIGSQRLSAVCFGKFFEYGNSAIDAIANLEVNFSEYAEVVLHLIGSDPFLNESALSRLDSRVKVLIHPRMRYSLAARFLSQMDLGVCIIRDPECDNGTKVYDYIGL